MMWGLVRFFQVNPFPEQHTLHRTDHFPGWATASKKLLLGNAHGDLPRLHADPSFAHHTDCAVQITHVNTIENNSFLQYHILPFNRLRAAC